MHDNSFLASWTSQFLSFFYRLSWFIGSVISSMQATVQGELLSLAKHNWPNSLRVEIKSEGFGNANVLSHIRVLKASQHSQVTNPRSKSFPGANLSLWYLLKQEWNHFWRLFLSFHIRRLKPWVCPQTPLASNMGRERTMGNSLLPLGRPPTQGCPTDQRLKGCGSLFCHRNKSQKSHQQSQTGSSSAATGSVGARPLAAMALLLPQATSYFSFLFVCWLFPQCQGQSWDVSNSSQVKYLGFTSPTPTPTASAPLPWIPVRRGRGGDKGVSFAYSVLWPLIQAGFLLE